MALMHGIAEGVEGNAHDNEVSLPFVEIKIYTDCLHSDIERYSFRKRCIREPGEYKKDRIATRYWQLWTGWRKQNQMHAGEW